MMNALALIPAYTHIDDRLQDALGKVGVPYHPARRCSDLPKARSLLLTLGLEQSKAEVFLLIDSDMAPAAEQVMQLLESPKLSEFSAVSGAYALPDGRTAFVPSDLDATVELGSPGFTSLRGAGLGFCAIHRHSLVNITRQLPRVTNTGPEWWPFCVPIFRSAGEVGKAEYFPDDYVLWLRHEAEGGLLWLDQELLIAHNFATPRRPVAGPVTRG
jgi:hypothetical protein